MSGGRGHTPSPPFRDGTVVQRRFGSAQAKKNSESEILKSPKHGSPGKPYLTNKTKIDIDQLPSKFRNLSRSSNIPKGQVWTSGIGPTSPGGPSEIIITDVALNQIPNIVIHEAQNFPKHSRITQPLSPEILQRRASGIPYEDRQFLQTKRNTFYAEEEDISPFQNVLSKFIDVFKRPPICGLDSVAPSPPPTEYERRKFEDTKNQKNIHGGWNLETDIDVVTSEPDFASRRGDLRGLFGKSTQDEGIPPPLTEKERHELELEKAFLDIQKNNDKAYMHPQRYLDDLTVLHNINRREMVSKMLYRDSGILFCRYGKPGEPVIPKSAHLLSSEGVGPEVRPPKNYPIDAPMPQVDRVKILKKVLKTQPRRLPAGEDEVPPKYKDSEFIQSCLFAHNLYRARHSAPPLELSPHLCELAQQKVNELAHKGKIEYYPSPEFGENFYCKNRSIFEKKKQVDVNGEEVAAYWYSNIKNYKFNEGSKVLSTHAGPFSQMVWVASREFGVGRARSRSGKVFVLAQYTPTGNIPDYFEENVQPLNSKALATEIIAKVEQEQRGSFLLPFASLRSAAVIQKPRDLHPSMSLPVDRTPFSIKGIIEPPTKVTGRNATKVLAAHMLGHAASVVPLNENDLQVVIHFTKDGKPKRDLFLCGGSSGYYVKEERERKSYKSYKKSKRKSIENINKNVEKSEPTEDNEKDKSEKDTTEALSDNSDSIPVAANKYLIEPSVDTSEENQSTKANLSYTNTYRKVLEKNHDKTCPVRLKTIKDVQRTQCAESKSEESLVFKPLEYKKLTLKTLSLDTVFRKLNQDNQIAPLPTEPSSESCYTCDSHPSFTEGPSSYTCTCYSSNSMSETVEAQRSSHSESDTIQSIVEQSSHTYNNSISEHNDATVISSSSCETISSSVDHQSPVIDEVFESPLIYEESNDSEIHTSIEFKKGVKKLPRLLKTAHIPDDVELTFNPTCCHCQNNDYGQSVKHKKRKSYTPDYSNTKHSGQLDENTTLTDDTTFQDIDLNKNANETKIPLIENSQTHTGGNMDRLNQILEEATSSKISSIPMMNYANSELVGRDEKINIDNQKISALHDSCILSVHKLDENSFNSNYLPSDNPSCSSSSQQQFIPSTKPKIQKTLKVATWGKSSLLKGKRSQSLKSLKSVLIRSPEDASSRISLNEMDLPNLPFQSPDAKKGLMNCYALSPVHY